MANDPHPSRTAGYKPGLAAFSAIAAIWVFVLVTLGAFTTTIGAGMAFQDWPLSNGSLNPNGWLSNIAMFAEHSHRLSAGMMTTLTVILALWAWRSEARAWLRKLTYFAVALVFAQALVGGLRVLLDHVQIASIGTSLGRVFAMLHACLAQAFVCTLIAVAVAFSRGWVARPVPAGKGVRTAGIVCVALIFVQLGVAAVMRHSFAGLAIPTFPFSTPEGNILPAAWDFRVAIQFTHRVMALVITVAVAFFVVAIWRDRGVPVTMKSGASALVSLLAMQIFLGAAIVKTLRNPAITTGHVLVGAVTLATAFWLTWSAHRDRIEGAP
ncbi:MAG TPA: COX15/CtaA family protein [Opitutaceae bacterium]|jgi:cytochrome c oxidase assembly protein subunit 15|nr:COX15/CtaA family protein [Opitutaceae bacterium]